MTRQDVMTLWCDVRDLLLSTDWDEKPADYARHHRAALHRAMDALWRATRSLPRLPAEGGAA